jgi:excisionase family DNA binding protein
MTARGPEALLPVREVAELWRCSVDHVYDLIAAGRLRHVQLGTGRRAKTRVPESALTEYVQRNSRRGGVAA